MAAEPFLAMTAAEIRDNSHLPGNLAWMACHFSPYGPGLSNVPAALPPGSLLMVDDVTPIRGHDPQIIADQLSRCADRLRCAGILLDFQRPDAEETTALVRYLTASLPCPVAVSSFYADACCCPICIPPVPPSELPEKHFAPWRGREIWLELALEGEEITVTESGPSVAPLPHPQVQETDFFAQDLLCHYRCEIRERDIKFTLYRTERDLKQLLGQSEKYGVTKAVGLYQEFGSL